MKEPEDKELKVLATILQKMRGSHTLEVNDKREVDKVYKNSARLVNKSLES